ncbi:hypothetical protein J5N97_017235 [Dioscorea zingiberensis]|uniref:DUF2428 domain-containing protein n=1 Tax=Dioscorea zingiberensis TaxID=325984 RepID=A0A9D5HG63_9LILI|nr:hypothetical protein J5N97_017235 [Dioscorea zingiberensis]
MEQCQEAMSCLYYLLQRFSSKFVGLEEDSNVFQSVLKTVLSVLQSSGAFSRDCLVASGVSFCAAVQAFMSHKELCGFISRGLFGVCDVGVGNGDLAVKKVMPDGDLYLEIRDLSSLSRLCLLRGILTAIPRTVLNAFVLNNGSIWTILYDGILPELCKHCENPIDSHFNFHALTVMQICFQQVKTSMLAELADFSGDYDAIPEEMSNRVLRIIWNNLEDPLSQTVKQGLAARAAYAYVDDDVCCSATSFLKCFLECLRDECWSLDGIENGYDTFRGLCLPPILRGLVSGNSKLRTNLNTYALPVVLNVDMDGIFSMLGFISVGPNGEESKFSADLNTDQRVAALVSLLKVSRSLALMDGDIDLDQESLLQEDISCHVAVVCVKGVNVRLPVEWFILALTHADDSLRIDAAESLFLNPKTASLPSSLELSLMKGAMPLNMRCSSTAFQMKWTSLFRKFFSRVRTALERQVKQGSWLPIESCNGNGDGYDNVTKDLVACGAENLFHFMKWLSCFLFYSCYPSAPYERKTMAMELILIMMDVWPPIPLSQGFCKMTETWMEQLMDRDNCKGQTVDDLLRRSAGIPAAFIAFFLSEPEGTPKKLLPWALRFLIDIASKSVCTMCEDGKRNGKVLLEDYIQNLDGTPSETITKEVDVSCRSSKSRDEGVVPTVHAFNVLRAAFNDTNLATDTSGFCAEALIISIGAFSSPYWEIRNSACLAYTALVRRMIGFLNVQKRESARRALTGLEFFHRYPALHPFLLSELKIVTEMLGDGLSRPVEYMTKAIHPSLCPILILLSRLKPSLISSETQDALDPFLLVPFIQMCATQSNFRVRVLASRALTGLVSNEKLVSVLSEIVHCLPNGPKSDEYGSRCFSYSSIS